MRMIPVYVGLDYHSDSVRVCVLTEDGEELLNRSVSCEVGTVVEFVRSGVERVSSKGRQEPGLPVVLGVALEACTGSAEFASRLSEVTEWPVKLAHASAVHCLKKGPDKTDHGDAWHLANLIRINYLPEVWLADEHTRQLRHLVRHRQSVMSMAKDVKLRIRSLLKEDGVLETQEGRAWSKPWLKWLREAELPEQSRWIVNEQLALLEHLQQKISETDQRMQEVTQDDPLVAKLLEQTSVGLVTALLIRAVVGSVKRFRNGKQLSRYCGVTPCNASSGKRQADAGLVPTGHQDLRAALIQLAKRLPRHDPRWKEFKENLGRRKPANVVSAAIANRWLRRLYHELVKVDDTSKEAVQKAA